MHEKIRNPPSVSVRVERGEPLPLGLHDCRGGMNLSVFSRHATRIALLLFDSIGARSPLMTLELGPPHHRTGDLWHVRLSGDLDGMLYVLQAEGPESPGLRFEPDRCLLDPYAAAVAGEAWSPLSPPLPGARNRARRGVIADHSFDWQDDLRPGHPWSRTIIYETHVRGLTIHVSAAAAHPGQFLGVVEKIPYLKRLGVTAVELMPVQAFDPYTRRKHDPVTGSPMPDYWGYDPVALFAPMPGYSSGLSAHAALTEFKTMVRELHRAGVEVILDVVFNHTAEGGDTGETYSFRGLDNPIYYILSPDRSRYVDFTGCGNTLNCNHPVVRGMIVDCLRHWVVEMHVDGFRFDLASILGRDAEGKVLSNPPLLEQIAEDPLLRDVKLIAEAWDSAGAFQVGRFPGTRWAEWNCHYRDEVRRFWRGDPGMTGRFATRLCGSADLYQQGGSGSPVKSINFVTCHDGFTLNDLVSYATKHNEPNGEGNLDGVNHNHSDNNGWEGPAEDAGTEAMRLRQIKNILTSLFVSRGVPMLLGGDEFRRTQGGNNNAYCQDNETSWYDWRLADQHQELVAFVSDLIALRKAHPVLSADRFYEPEEIEWFGPNGGPADWDGPNNQLGCVINAHGTGALCLLFNASAAPCRFVVPIRAESWRVAVDTAASAPRSAVVPGGEMVLVPRCTRILVAMLDAEAKPA
ncbi:glycogen debranching enzyme GlgX [Alsobacter soli]|uniref:Glycogen debranching enzyme GlgX n=1 Tax=Alsobacter soli TaxID=2109933 RepID=A0A2T1HLM7_9HYPH|nr:glycogen debranching protein GlgX [Alsobacter soli]PSC02553.1 glycogen debranching enzyme GlgX [Alsobacter soli]